MSQLNPHGRRDLYLVKLLVDNSVIDQIPVYTRRTSILYKPTSTDMEVYIRHA